MADERRQWMNVLANLPIFERTRSDTLEALLRASTFRRYDAAVRLVVEGAPAKDMFVLLKGAVRAVVGDGGDFEYTQVIFRAPAQFAELAALSGSGHYGSSIETITESVLAAIPATALERAIADDHGLCQSWLYSVVRQFSSCIQRRRQEYFADHVRRVSQLFLSYVEAMGGPPGPEVLVPMSYARLAREIGCARRSAIRVMKTLEEQRAVRSTAEGWMADVAALREHAATALSLVQTEPR